MVVGLKAFREPRRCKLDKPIGSSSFGRRIRVFNKIQRRLHSSLNQVLAKWLSTPHCSTLTRDVPFCYVEPSTRALGIFVLIGFVAALGNRSCWEQNFESRVVVLCNHDGSAGLADVIKSGFCIIEYNSAKVTSAFGARLKVPECRVKNEAVF